MEVKFIRIFILLVGMVLLVSCSPGEEASEDTVEGKTDMKIFMPNYSERDLETNSFTAFVEEEFDVNLIFETTSYDSAAAKERRQISLSSGDYPDVYFMIPWVDQFSANEMLRYGNQGVLLPLNDLIKDHAPNLQEVLDTDAEYRALATAPDGNIYGIPQLIECFHCTWPNKMWLNSTWLDNLGLDVPETHEELKEVLTAFKNDDPNGNGEKDEIPLSGSISIGQHSVIPFLMNGFVYDDVKTRLTVDNDQVSFVANKEEWKQGLEYIHELYEDGLIDPGAFTQNAEAYTQLGSNADEVILGAGPSMHPNEFANNDNSLEYDAIAPLAGPNAAYSVYKYPIEQGATFALTNKASEEVQVKALKLLDYMFTTEGSLRAMFGEEGESWEQAEEGDVAINEDVEPLVKEIHSDDERNNNWGASAQYYHPVEFRDSWVQAEDIYTQEGYERRLQEATYLYEGTEPERVFPYWSVWFDEIVQEEVATLETNIKTNVEQSAVRFIVGELDFDSDWDSYLAGLESLGVDRYVEIMQEAYDQYLENVN
ncbi:extracellular solute-binding protein [Alkalicoccobacillus porphyridii]|uniref:Extracellular solute-binding protein n=1 Tax=Alkalicoccobacillus porphyridii TaxID=2597270 RepID=A0A554A036_9BACI|nr:extracellular solute-binding protein [Alkalicoccobacillus porphyridii]TSB47058.1 extracellular solute-binding protein [Alkalicoccobacillus porphyridii]